MTTRTSTSTTGTFNIGRLRPRWCGILSDQLAFAGVDPRERRVLDAGSGFGMSLVFCGFLGAASLFGLEIREKMVRTCKASSPLLPDRICDRLDVRTGDVASMPYEDSSFDLGVVERGDRGKRSSRVRPESR
jgi:SAM-dependent methyltransferase